MPFSYLTSPHSYCAISRNIDLKQFGLAMCYFLMGKDDIRDGWVLLHSDTQFISIRQPPNSSPNERREQLASLTAILRWTLPASSTELSNPTLSIILDSNSLVETILPTNTQCFFSLNSTLPPSKPKAIPFFNCFIVNPSLPDCSCNSSFTRKYCSPEGDLIIAWRLAEVPGCRVVARTSWRSEGSWDRLLRQERLRGRCQG